MPEGLRHKRSARRSQSTPSASARTTPRNVGTVSSRSPRPSSSRSSLCWRLGPATRRRSGAPSPAWAWPRPRPRGRKANRANLNAIELRNFDSSTFEAWFSAYTVHNQQAMALAERRFRPAFRVAFEAWRATKPETNPQRAAGTDLHAAVPPAGARRRRRRSTRRRTRPSPPARARARRPTNTSAPPSSSRASSSWSASAPAFLDAGAVRARWAWRCDPGRLPRAAHAAARSAHLSSPLLSRCPCP